MRVTVVQEALRKYLTALPSGSRVDLIAFNAGLSPDQEVILKDKQDLARAGSPGLMVWQKGSEPRGKGTCLWTTVRHALKTASKYSKENPSQPVTVRVLTNGEDNEHVTTLERCSRSFSPCLMEKRSGAIWSCWATWSLQPRCRCQKARSR